MSVEPAEELLQLLSAEQNSRLRELFEKYRENVEGTLNKKQETIVQLTQELENLTVQLEDLKNKAPLTPRDNEGKKKSRNPLSFGKPKDESKSKGSLLLNGVVGVSTSGGNLFQRIRGNTAPGSVGGQISRSMDQLPTLAELLDVGDLKVGSIPLNLVKGSAIKNPDISARFFAQYLYKSSEFILCVLDAAAQNLSSSKTNEVVQAMLDLTESFNQKISLDVIRKTIKQEVQRTSEDPTTLFRVDNLSSKLLRTYTKMIGEPLLKSLTEPIQQILSDTAPFEVDPMKFSPQQDPSSLVENQNTLLAYVQLVFDRITASVDQLPIQVRKIVQCLDEEVSQKFPDSVQSSNNAIAGYIFLRFVCPAVTAPESWGVLLEPPSLEGRRKLMLVSKILQTLASGATIKEEFLCFASGFITKNLPLLRNFFDSLMEQNNSMEFYRPTITMQDISASMKCVLSTASQIKPAILSYWAPDSATQVKNLAMDSSLLFQFLMSSNISFKSFDNPYVSGFIQMFLDCSPFMTAIIRLIASSKSTKKPLVNSGTLGDLSLLQSLILATASFDRYLKLFKLVNEDPSLSKEKEKNSFLHKIFREHCKLYACDFLKKSIGHLLQDICTKPSIDPEAETKQILQSLLKFISVMCPKQIWDVFYYLSIKNVEASEIVNYMFVDWICPAIESPQAYKIVDEDVSPKAHRGLLSVTECLLKNVSGKDAKSIQTILMSWAHQSSPLEDEKTTTPLEKGNVLASYNNIFLLCKDNQQHFSCLSGSMMNQVVSYTARDFLDWIIDDTKK